MLECSQLLASNTLASLCDKLTSIQNTWKPSCSLQLFFMQLLRDDQNIKRSNVNHLIPYPPLPDIFRFVYLITFFIMYQPS